MAVLHLGAVGFTDLKTEERVKNFPSTLHARISRIADVTGVDYSSTVIEELKKIGIRNLIFGNAERLEELELNRTFDLIVVGDLIEHLANPGLMLQGLGRFCHKDTQIIITTPNAFGLAGMIRYLTGHFREGEEHVMCFNIYNIRNLLNRYRFQVISEATCHQDKAASLGLLFRMGKGIFRLFPRLGGTLFLVVRPYY